MLKTGEETSQIIRSGLILVVKDSAEKGGTAYAIGKGSPPLSLSIAPLCKAATVSDSRLETYSLYYLLYFFFRLTTVVPITAPPLMNRSAIHKTRLLLSPVFGEVVLPKLPV